MIRIAPFLISALVLVEGAPRHTKKFTWRPPLESHESSVAHLDEAVEDPDSQEGPTLLELFSR